MRWIALAVAALLGVAGLAIWSWLYVTMGPAQIVIENASSGPIHDVVVSGRGFSFAISELERGESSCHTIDFAGETKFRVEASSGDQRSDSGMRWGIEGGLGERQRVRVLDGAGYSFLPDPSGYRRLWCWPAV